MVEDRTLRESSSRIFQRISQQPERLKLRRGSLPSRLQSHASPQGPAHRSELRPGSGMLQPPLPSFPFGHPPPRLSLPLGPGPSCVHTPRSLKGSPSCRSEDLFSNVTSQRGLPWPPFPPHCHTLACLCIFFSQRLKFTSGFCLLSVLAVRR